MVSTLRAYVESLGGVLTLAPGPGDGTPEIAWGDLFFYYAPDGVLPNTQPFATIVTKDYPDDTSSNLTRPGAYRVNIAVGKSAMDAAAPTGPDDTVIVHPVYGSLGWVAVVNPVAAPVRELLGDAHALAKARWERREG